MRHRRKKREKKLLSDLPPYFFRNKVAGWVFLNGNIPDPRDLVNMFADRILNPEHPDPEINKSKRVTLVTAAFESGHEFHDRHLILDFEQIGIDAGWRGGFPTNVRNLAVWNSFKKWKESETWLYQKYTEKQDAVLAMKRDYHSKMQGYVETVTQHLKILTQEYSELGLFEFYHMDDWKSDPSTILSESVRAHEQIERDMGRIKKRKADAKRARDLRNIIDHLVYKDSEVLAACKGIEDHFMHASGLQSSELYQVQGAALKKNLLDAATIFIYGGRVYVLMNRLRFYGLHDALREAVQKGSNLYGISAGSCIQSDQFSLAVPNAPSGGYQIAADEGVGLLKRIKVFPHAYDYYQYIRDGSRDDLSFFALRNPGYITVGLNQTSVLLREEYQCKGDSTRWLRYSSVGDEPVLVFGPKGRRYEMGRGDQLILPGTRSYEGSLQLARVHEMESVEATSR